MSIFRQPLVQNPPQNLRRRDSNFDSDGGDDWNSDSDRNYSSSRRDNDNGDRDYGDSDGGDGGDGGD